MKIHKFPMVDWARTRGLDVPINSGYKILKLGLQENTPTLWCEVDPSVHLVVQKVVFIKTGGHPPHADEGFNYIDSFEYMSGQQVHVYIKRFD